MTETNDTDRRLSAWLEDGPSRATERSIDAAVAHARAHARRRDPFAFLRKDPIDTMTRPAASRPLLLAAAVGLLIVASVAAASVGGFLDRLAVIVPVATATPTPSTAPSPESSPSVIDVDLIEKVGADATIRIIDQSHTLVAATSGTPGDGGSVPDGTVAVTTRDPSEILLTWTGAPCDTVHTLTIAPDGRTMTIERPTCTGDTIAVDHVLRLTFSGPVAIDSLKVAIRNVGG